jgi:hypothetical protein
VIKVGEWAFKGFSNDRSELSVQKAWDLKSFAIDTAFSRGYKNLHRRLDELGPKSRLQEGLVKPLILTMGIKPIQVG